MIIHGSNDLFVSQLGNWSCVDGNERADTLAKLGAAKEQHAVSVSQATIKQIIQSKRKKWTGTINGQ